VFGGGATYQKFLAVAGPASVLLWCVICAPGLSVLVMLWWRDLVMYFWRPLCLGVLMLDVFPFLLNETATLALYAAAFCVSFGLVRLVRCMALGLPIWFFWLYMELE
jgi:hypothetical protein